MGDVPSNTARRYNTPALLTADVHIGHHCLAPYIVFKWDFACTHFLLPLRMTILRCCWWYGAAAAGRFQFVWAAGPRAACASGIVRRRRPFFRPWAFCSAHNCGQGKTHYGTTTPPADKVFSPRTGDGPSLLECGWDLIPLPGTTFWARMVSPTLRCPHPTGAVWTPFHGKQAQVPAAEHDAAMTHAAFLHRYLCVKTLGPVLTDTVVLFYYDAIHSFTPSDHLCP